MKSIFLVICDAGDGSNYLEWHKTLCQEKIKNVTITDDKGGYAVGVCGQYRY